METPLRVSELSRNLKTHIEETFKSVYVQGEISGFKKHTSGHSYFALKDNEAVLDAVCWRGTKLSVELAEGLEVIVRGRITTYMGRSKYQMIVEEAKASGEGALMKLLLERKERLQKEGLFSQKRPLPSFPKTIGIITSSTGAVIQDILHRLEERYPCHVMLWPVLVQGQGANDQVAKAIEGFNKMEKGPDVIIVARGGGSIEDLWTFNEENVLRAAFASHIPLISAIGHETDFTLLDFVADLRAPTPTAAAELATPVLRQVVDTICYQAKRIESHVQNLLNYHALHLKALSGKNPQSYLDDLCLRFDDWSERLMKAPKNLFERYAQKMTLSLKHPRDLFENASERFAKTLESFSVVWGYYLQAKKEKIERFDLCLKHGAPQRILERGFCWVKQGDQMLTRKEEVQKVLPTYADLTFVDGTLRVKLENIKIAGAISPRTKL